MTTLEGRRCYVCNKIFCCSDCCCLHFKKEHSSREAKCPLCRSEGLRVKTFDNQELLCHIVFHHLPLRCRLCGVWFKDGTDLKNLGVCDPRLLYKTAASLQKDTNESSLAPETYTSFNKTPRGQTGAKRDGYSINGDYNGNFASLTSPPELSRHTSTPMHANLIGGGVNFAFKTPRSPNISLKTPKTTTQSLKNARRNENLVTDDKSVSSLTDCKDPESPNSESNYFSLTSSSRSSVNERTPLRSILSNRSSPGESCNQEFSRSNGRKLGTTRELDEENEIEMNAISEMELTNAEGGLLSENSPLSFAGDNVSHRRVRDHRDAAKRVRFSDQFEIKSDAEGTTASSLNATEGEEFFEARQSMSEMSIAVVEKLSASSVRIDRENEENSEKEKQEIPAVESGRSEEHEIREKGSVSNASSSRVVMMVVVEKNGSLNGADLAPLIDSSLKKLESVSASGAVPRRNSIELSAQISQDRSPVTTVVSVDSYMSVSTVECYATPDSTVAVPPRTRQSPDNTNSSGQNGGIFSAVAHAMRVAFRNLSGAATTSRNSRSGHVSQKEILALPSSTTESSSASPEASEDLATALVPRTSKRTRDAEEMLSIQSAEAVDLEHDIRSPMPKRQRGWYKIRAREPIARMRNDNNPVTSPRGVSSETQCFQQGSLSVGDMILPIPSRAHQSTQTDH